MREAIGRLEQEGLLKVFPKRGIFVSSFTISDISMIFEVRRLIEPYTLRHYGDRIDRSKIAEFAAIFDKLKNEKTLNQFYQLDDEFHSTLIAALDNDYLRDLYSRIRTQTIRLRVMSGQMIDTRLQLTMSEHAEIAAACLEGNWELAALAMSKHLQYSEESSLATLLKSKSSAVSFDFSQSAVSKGGTSCQV